MYLYQVSGYRYAATSEMNATVVVKDDGSQISITMLPEEVRELEALGERIFMRNQAALAAKMAQPLETNLLAAPTPPAPIEEAVFTDVADEDIL